MPNAPVAAAATGLPISDQTLLRPADLSQFTINELDGFYEALVAAGDAMTSIANQPRMKCGGQAHNLLTGWQDQLETEASRVIAELRSRATTDFWKSRERLYRLIVHEARCGAGSGEFVALVDEMVAAERRSSC